MTDVQGSETPGQERPGMIPFGDTETALRREVAIVAERFPDTDIAVVDAAVREAFAELSANAEVDVHLLALTRHRSLGRLEEQGHAFHPSSAEAEPDDGDAEVDSGEPADEADRLPSQR
jgi:hypothetical protein